MKAQWTKHILSALAFLALAAPVQARTVDCETIAARAGANAGIPEALLPAISRVETGLKQGEKGVRAWPWTLNVQGKGYYFKTRDEALTKLREVLASGVRNVDVGCMQINYRWHNAHFASLEEMISPEANTRYAAQFLTRLKDRHGSWETATKYYHSSESERGDAYLGRVQRVVAKLPQQQPSFVASTADNRPETHQAAAVVPAEPQRPSAVVTNPHGVLALASNPLIALDEGMLPGAGVAALPDSPVPQITQLSAAQSHRRGLHRKPQLSSNRQDLLAQLRAEFAD